VKAICVVGSPAVRSRTGTATRQVADLLTQRGFDVTLVNLADRGLPHTDPETYWSGDPHPMAAVRAFVAAVLDADAVVLGTPVQHASYSGLLKSAIDLLPDNAFADKAVGLVANAGGQRGSTIACEHLRSVVKALGGWSVPTQVTTNEVDFGADGALVAGGPLRRCAELADQILAFTKAMRPPPAGLG
jgi:NAD(P)H-dependent FMN reductase